MATAKKAPVQKTSFLEEHSGAGLENIGADDLQVPRLKLLNALSPELDEAKPNYIAKSRAGQFALTLPGISLGKTVDVIPLHNQTFWVEYLPSRSGYVGRHLPGSFPVDQTDFSNWFRPDNGNEIVETRDWVVLVKGHEEVGPVLMSFTSSAIKSSKSWMSLIAIERTPAGKAAPIFANIWKLSSVAMSNEKGSWHVVSTMPEKVRMITEKEFNDHVDNARQVATTIQTQMLPAPSPAQAEQKAVAEKVSKTKIDY